MQKPSGVAARFARNDGHLLSAPVIQFVRWREGSNAIPACWYFLAGCCQRKRRHNIAWSSPARCVSTPVFVGTRVPFRNLIDYLERNHSLDEFLDSFPTVSREQAVAALEIEPGRSLCF